MKTIFFGLISFGIITLIIGFAQAEGIETGFGNINWTTSLEKVSDCEKIEERGDIQYCVRRNQMHSLLGESTPDVLYGFYTEVFFSVFIRIEDDEAYLETKNRLKEELGAPESSFNHDGIVSILRWTRGKVRVELHNDRSKEGFRLVYYYVPIADKALRIHKRLFPSKWEKIKLFPEIERDAPENNGSESIGILQF